MPIRLAIADDYEVVIRGLAEMLRSYADVIEVVELDSNVPVAEPVDIALYDTFAQSQADGPDVDDLLQNPRVRRVVVYSWNIQPRLVSSAIERGAAGYLSKGMTADELVKALRLVHDGETITPHDDGGRPIVGGDWPGREEGLTAREAEVIALITQGLSNADIAERAALSINSVKSYIRASYRKMGVTSRTNAVLWGLDHGFAPDRSRIRKNAPSTD